MAIAPDDLSSLGLGWESSGPALYMVWPTSSSTPTAMVASQAIRSPGRNRSVRDARAHRRAPWFGRTSTRAARGAWTTTKYGLAVVFVPHDERIFSRKASAALIPGSLAVREDLLGPGLDHIFRLGEGIGRELDRNRPDRLVEAQEAATCSSAPAPTAGRFLAGRLGQLCTERFRAASRGSRSVLGMATSATARSWSKVIWPRRSPSPQLAEVPGLLGTSSAPMQSVPSTEALDHPDSSTGPVIAKGLQEVSLAQLLDDAPVDAVRTRDGSSRSVSRNRF